MTEEQLTHFRQLLQTEKGRLEQSRASVLTETRSDDEAGRAGELSDYDPNDPADEAGNLFDHERDLSMLDNEDRLLRKINRALQKIEEGTYGLSDVDGSAIPLERLEALPYALATKEQEEETI